MHRPDGDKISILPMAARTATVRSKTVRITGVRAIIFMIDVSAVVATPTLTTIEIFLKSPSGRADANNDIKLYDWTLLTIGAVGVFAFCLSPYTLDAEGWTATPIKGVVPPQFEVKITHGDADSITYSLDAYLIY